MKRPLSFRKRLIAKIIMISAPVFLFFFLLVGFITESLLEKQIINNADEIINALLMRESEQINRHFKSLENLGEKSAAVIAEWITKGEGISNQEFNRKFKIQNGALRTNISAYSDSSMSGVFLSNFSPMTPEIRKIISVTENKFDEYAKATKPFVFNMYLITKQHLIRIYEKDWALEIEANHDFNNDIFYNIATPENNPGRLPQWTKPYYDSIWERWMTSLITPIYIENEFIGIVGHDVILNEIYDEVINQRYFKTGYGFIFDSEKNLIIHPHYLVKLEEKADMGDLLSTSELGDYELKNIIADGITKFSKGETKIKDVYEFHGKTYVVFTSKLEMLNWFYSIDIPLEELSEATSGFGTYFFFGALLFSTFLFSAVVWVMWILVVKPIKILQGATEEIVAGNLNKTVEVKTEDEIGKLSVSFNVMISQINQKIGEIKEAEEKYRNIFESAVEGIFQGTHGGRFVSANTSAAKILGFDSPQELIQFTNENNTDLFVDKNRREEIVDLFSDSNIIKDEEVRVYKKDGSIIWLSFNIGCVRDENNKITLVEGLFSDITERKEWEEKLMYSNTILETQQETSPDGILIIDLAGKVIKYNKRFLQMWGIPESIVDNATDKILRDYIIDKLVDPESFSDRVNYLIEHTEEKSYDEIELKGDILFERFSTPLISEEGHNYGRIWYFKDITETKKAQSAIIEAKERAELSERVKSEFLAQVSHEIRTPISAILSFSNLIKDELQDKVDPDLRDGFMTINRAGMRIIRTIDLILNMSEIQSGSYEYKGKQIDIYEDIILFTSGEYKQLAKEKNLKLLIKHKTKNTEIFADEYTVSQIMQNLVDNAIKYTLAGCVEIIIDRNEDDNLTVAVKDTGIGISKEYLPHLFSAFTQEEQGYTRKFEGNGLGLALIKKYCELNNAEISVESEKNVGTVFTVTFKNK